MRFFVHIRKNFSFFLLSLLSLKSANGWLTANCNKSFSNITGDSSDITKLYPQLIVNQSYINPVKAVIA